MGGGEGPGRTSTSAATRSGWTATQDVACQTAVIKAKHRYAECCLLMRCSGEQFRVETQAVLSRPLVVVSFASQLQPMGEEASLYPSSRRVTQRLTCGRLMANGTLRPFLSPGAGQPIRLHHIVWGPRALSRRHCTCSSTVGPSCVVGPWPIHPSARSTSCRTSTAHLPSAPAAAPSNFTAALPDCKLQTARILEPPDQGCRPTHIPTQPYRRLLSHLLRLHAREAVS
jgi:hypothetical protein